MATFPKLKLAVLLSGSGTTLANLIEQINAQKLNAEIVLVIGSRPGLKGMDRAKAANLPTLVVDPRGGDPADFNQQIFTALDDAKAELVCLAGWLCLLEIPWRYEGRILNIHPSLLPSFGGKGMYGLKVHQAVLDRGCTITGCTVHYVDNEYDNGPVLLQRVCPVLPGDTPASLAARVFEQEKIAYPEAIQLYQQKLPGASPQSLSPADIRKDYRLAELRESDAAADPIEQFGRWFKDAQRSDIEEPTAMTLATADASGRPSARIMLLKAFDASGFTFYTNRKSNKGRDLEQNPRASLVIFWGAQERQVRVSGSVEQLSHEESEKYFHVRPIPSQIGAWASQQSTVLSSREELDKREAELTAKFAGKVIPMPDYWGGYRVIPTEIEFWQGGHGRLHDRLRYTRVGSGWKMERLSP